MSKVSRLHPLLEFTLRKLEKPFTTNYRELVRAFCVSIGLVQPADSRDVIVDVLVALLKYRPKQKLLYTQDVQKIVSDYRAHIGLPVVGVSQSNILRALKILRTKGIAEVVSGGYRIREWSLLTTVFETHLQEYLIKTTIERIKEYSDRIDSIT
ncbi:hypothetical protein COT72_03020 [archaeon CG10_big_fil_rev_8_21_14_0_10_43_11]|nr:MAG: hypothetical protein COT72_03020 [archaeon CG10_big_fil_rev_8_21_14_0_10_43_11]